MKSSQELFNELYNSLPNNPNVYSRLFSYKLFLIIEDNEVKAKFISKNQYQHIKDNKNYYCENIEYISHKLKNPQNLINEFYNFKNSKVIKYSYDEVKNKLFIIFNEAYKVFIETLNFKMKVKPFNLIEMGDKEHYNLSLDINKNSEMNQYLYHVGITSVTGYSYDKLFKKYLKNKPYFKDLSFDSDNEDFIMYLNKKDFNIVIKDIINLITIIKDKNKLKELL